MRRSGGDLDDDDCHAAVLKISGAVFSRRACRARLTRGLGSGNGGEPLLPPVGAARPRVLNASLFRKMQLGLALPLSELPPF